MDVFVQAWIALTGLTGVYLSQQGNEDLKRYACFFGLAGQPAWFYATISAEQWGILALSVFYTYAWFNGFRNHWMRRS